MELCGGDEVLAIDEFIPDELLALEPRHLLGVDGGLDPLVLMVDWHRHVAPPRLAGRGDALTESPDVIAAEHIGGLGVVDLARKVAGGLDLALDERWGT